MVNLSPRPRPPGRSGGVTTTKSLWAWTLLALHATTAQAASLEHFTQTQRSRPPTTQQTSIAPRRSQPGGSPAEIPYLDTRTAKVRNAELKRRNDDEAEQYADVLRYPEALAPAQDESAVRAPLGQSNGAIGPSALPARLLQDWEATDIILLSTVDGAIHARDRDTGLPRWVLNTGEPMIETIQIPQSSSEFGEEETPAEYKFFVEPSPDGQLFALFSDPTIGLIRSHKTVKRMAAETPFRMEMKGYSFMINSVTLSKSYTVDAATGEVLNQFPRPRNWNGEDTQPRCRRRNELELQDPACKSGRILRLGRSVYEFTVSDELSGSEVYTIRFSEWVPYANDKVLQDQYRRSLDGFEVRIAHDGEVVGVDTHPSKMIKKRWGRTLECTVARIYDVLRPINADEESSEHSESSELIVLARPSDLHLQGQQNAWREALQKHERVVLNKTGNGIWYAMSEYSYPGATIGANPARMTSGSGDRPVDLDGDLDDVIGVHILSGFNQKAKKSMLTIGSGLAEEEPSIEENQKIEVYQDRPPAELPVAQPTNITPMVAFPYVVLLLFSIFYITANRKKVAAMIKTNVYGVFSETAGLAPENKAETIITKNTSAEPEPYIEPNLPVVTDIQTAPVYAETSSDHPVLPGHQRHSSTSGSGSPKKKSKHSDHDEDDSDVASEDEDGQDATNSQSNGAKPRWKTKRGKRGGRKNKKKKMDPATFDEKPMLAVEQHLDGGLLQVGTLKIDTREDSCLGRGSNGTAVYPGMFNGREVAVKRLIKSTNDLAKKEIKHLMSSDENPHVVRFHTHEESRDFFYIALDRFTASLDQFIEHPDMFPTLMSGVKGFDVKDCLRQITYGVEHLHSLKLVHRDIKPQNVLVKAIKSNRPTPEMPPLLFVISDFGLCKPLEEGAMSTFAPTANHTAAGTTGWRAPELLVGPRDTIAAPSAESTQSVSTNHSREGTVIDPPTGRRATKAIDIFSLGCVFYYVMTQGGHPFDKGGTSLGRDLNIKEDNLTTELLQLFKYEYDADDLILQMLKHNPKERPDCARVLRHPYFWTQEQKLDFLCLVSDSYEGEKNSINNIHDSTAVRTPSELAALAELVELETLAPDVIGTRNDGTVRDFLTALPKSFLNEMGKQRKYTGSKMIDLLRVIRNKKNHFKDLPADVKELILRNVDGQLAGYYGFWAERFPSLTINCHALIVQRGLVGKFGLERWYE